MNHGIKVSKQGQDLSGKSGKSDDSTLKDKAHILYMLAFPYVFGAREQVERYKSAADLLEISATVGVQRCLHEASTLFEDLNTIGKYAEMCGDTHEKNALWLDIRNHIRHDVREEFENESDKRKNERAARLGIDQRLQASMGFSTREIKIGSTVVTLAEVDEYISWAAGTMTSVVAEAVAKGLIRGEQQEQVT